MPRVMYLGLQAFATEPQQLLPTAENPLACQFLVNEGSPPPLKHQGELLVEHLDEEGLNTLKAWLKEDTQRLITIAWPQPQPWLAACLLTGEAAEKALVSWQQQAKYLLALFRSARRQVALVGYVPGQALNTITAPESQPVLPPVYQLAAAQLISPQSALQEAYDYLKASSQESQNDPLETIEIVTSALGQHRDLQSAEQDNRRHQAQLQQVNTQRDTQQEELARLKGELTAARDEYALALQQLHDVQEALEEQQQQHLDDSINKLEQRLAQLHKTQEQLEKSHQNQAYLRQKVETRQKELNMLHANSQAHIQHLERLVQWLRVHAQRHIAAVYRKIRSYKKTLPKQAAMLEASQFFDADWYLEQYPDVAKAGIKPAEHFIKFGALDGRDPGPLFSTVFYLTHYKDVAASGQHPLLHYLRHGITEQRQTRPEQRHLPALANAPTKENAQ